MKNTGTNPNKNPSPLELASLGGFSQIESELLSSKNTTERELLKDNEAGKSLLSQIIDTGNLKKLTTKSLTTKVLESNFKGKDAYIHLIAKKGYIDHINPETLSEELLSIPGEKGLSSYHILAKNEYLFRISKDLLTLQGLTLEDKKGVTPLQILLATEAPSDRLPKELLTAEVLLKEDNGKKAPIHSWANGRYWMLIPPEFITKKSLKSIGKESLLKSILYQYAKIAPWYKRTDKLLHKMEDLTIKSIKLGDKKELLQINKQLEDIERGNTCPNGFKNASTLIKEELTQRSILKELSNSEKEIEL